MLEGKECSPSEKCPEVSRREKAIASWNHQVARQTAKLSAGQGKPTPWAVFHKEEFGNPRNSEEGSELDTIEIVAQYLNFTLLPIFH